LINYKNYNKSDSTLFIGQYVIYQTVRYLSDVIYQTVRYLYDNSFCSY